ncbi:zinc finger protein 569 [Bombyx mori]|uniref:C2H2-type domain-containing protein n=1 Tax=Bombyx mori TaxID=7091 RepID=A0A8R2LX27_BOMMO|nr:zinc finger protein 569 [Bombyx mori]XP_037868343.1 zinc finger protein 569 [Bombyx mori]
MSSDSEDEPLSVLAAKRRAHPETKELILPEAIVIETRKRKKKKYVNTKGLSISIQPAKPIIIERPVDVWLYLKDLSPAGPYSCLLCSFWFTNRSRLVVHYILNHKKDFCGICRYFVPNRESWTSHLQFHTPWPCSQCIQNFATEKLLRDHMSTAHNLVHCRLCHFRVADDDLYNSHLFQKHNITNTSTKSSDILWDIQYKGAPKFACRLCSKPNVLSRTFFNHYMGYHHFTLKCFTQIISGTDPPFDVNGADLSSEFVSNELSTKTAVGYVDLDKETHLKIAIQEKPQISMDVKDEVVSDEDTKSEEVNAKCEKEESIVKNYKGDEDFDVTLMEMIVLQKCYLNHIDELLNDKNGVTKNSYIAYDKALDEMENFECAICKSIMTDVLDYYHHLTKMHITKCTPYYMCRVCSNTFETLSDLESHVMQEIGEFDDLWICQFCDKEFENRVTTRRHLEDHLQEMEYDNCFSPHLGFKCRYCPILFWNEGDRETHQIKVHFSMHRDDYYKCESCDKLFSDQVWFLHHYLSEHQESNSKVPTFLYKCCLCLFCFPSIDAVRSHFSAEHPEARKVFCSLPPCKYKPLSQRKSFKIHLKTLHSPKSRGGGLVECPVCSRDFKSQKACNAHITQMHGIGRYKCKLCKESLHSSDERKLHYLIRHPGQHPYTCTQCGKSFQYKSSLYMHKQEHMPNRQNLTCNYCNKVFLKKDSFREHLLIHEGPQHACSYCPMRFVQRSNMLRHERRHTGERPYACPHCDRTFADKGACNAHVRSHSRETMYACMYCGQTFVQKSKLTYHVRKHTGENLETCSVCSKLFTSVCSLREHMKTHEEKTFNVKCPLCDKKYQDERYMLRHLRTAHTRARFPCPLCGKCLSSSVGLRLHVITHAELSMFHCKVCPKGFSVKKTMMKHLRRRHGLKGTELNITDYYNKLDPRDCKLGLDEEVMTSIFGPPKRIVNDVLVGDFVTVHNQRISKAARQAEASKSDEDDTEENEPTDNDAPEPEESDRESQEEVTKQHFVSIKMEKIDSDTENTQNTVELEPTDFVSVKIEPLDSIEDIND